MKSPDLVTPLLPALRQYQLSLAVPKPAAGMIDAATSARGKALFEGAANCLSCHSGPLFTDADVDADVLHTPAEVGQSAAYAARPNAIARHRCGDCSSTRRTSTTTR